MTCCNLIVKRKADRGEHAVVYSDWLPEGDVIVDAVAYGEGLDVIARPNGQLVALTISGGEEGKTHKVRLTIETAQGRIKNDYVPVRIK